MKSKTSMEHLLECIQVRGEGEGDLLYTTAYASGYIRTDADSYPDKVYAATEVAALLDLLYQIGLDSETEK